MRLDTILKVLLSAAVLAVAANAHSDTSYSERAGSSAGVYQNEDLNFELDLTSTSYFIVDFSEQVPDASFAAMRFEPLIFSMTVVEDLGLEMTAEQYANIVKTATVANFGGGVGELHGEITKIGETDVDGVKAIQLGFSGTIDDTSANYVITAFVKGSTAYQLTSFGGHASAVDIKNEADLFASAFSFLGERHRPVVAAKQIDQYRSSAFAYKLAADPDIWFPWADLENDYELADTGALGAKGYGAVVMPFCWQGMRPTHLALLDVFLEQFGEEYPTPFITHEEPILKGDATGFYLSGEETADGELYTYQFWVVASERCAYSVGAWGPARLADTPIDLAALWDRFSINDAPTIFDHEGSSSKDRQANAFFLNQTGMHYYDARSYREAYRFLSQAADLDTVDSTYLMNALRALTELDAYQEAYDWLQPRLGHYDNDQHVRSWEAWLAYQVNETDKSVEIYEELFHNGYREDDEFTVYLEMLADREQWEKIDADFAHYAGDSMTDALRRLKASLLSKRGRHDDALAILNDMTAGRPFSADLVYAKIDVYDAMENPAEILTLANSLIENNYESLESWFYKGYAEFSLKSYPKSRESFEKALKFSPTSSFVKEYIDAVNGILGEGDSSSISAEVAVVDLPRDLKKQLDTSAFANTKEGYGALFLNRIVGYDFDGGEYVTQSYYQQIKIQDAQGIEQFSTLEFSFDPAFEQLYVNSLEVRNEHGELLAEADRAAFYVTDTVDGYEASTEQTAHLPVPSLKPGVVIDVVVSKKIGVESGRMPLEIHYLSSSRPIEYSALFVNGDTNKYSYHSFGVGKPRKAGGSQIWELTDPIVYRWEPIQPYFDRILPWVYVGTTSADWKKAGAEYFSKIEHKLDVERVRNTANRLVRGIDDDARKIEIISRYVQKELHYEAIEFGRRAYIPKAARETLRDRYGDCKDHAVLLYSLLNAADIAAELALVNINQKVLSELPNVDQFDHMIVSVAQSEKRLFIDATDKDFSLGTMPPRYLAGNHALIIGGQSELVQIPDFAPGDSSLHVEREVQAIDSSEIQILEVGTFSGYQAAELRGQLRDIESSEMLATMQRWVGNRYSEAVVVDALVDNLLEADSELIVEIQYRLSINDGDSFKMPGFFEAEYLDYDRLADRRFVFEMPAPFNVSAVTTVLQSGSAKLAVASNKPQQGESRFAHWRRIVDKSEDSWVFRLEYNGRKSEFAADDYSDFAEFHRHLIGSIEQPVSLH